MQNSNISNVERQDNKIYKLNELQSSSDSSDVSSTSSGSSNTKPYAGRDNIHSYSYKPSLAHSINHRLGQSSIAKEKAASNANAHHSGSLKTTIDTIVGPGKQFLTEVIKKMNSYVTAAHKRHILSHTPTLSAYQSLEELNKVTEMQMLAVAGGSKKPNFLRRSTFKLPLKKTKSLKTVKQVDKSQDADKKKYPEKTLASFYGKQVTKKSPGQGSKVVKPLTSKSARVASVSGVNKSGNNSKIIIKSSTTDGPGGVIQSGSKTSLHSKIQSISERLHSGKRPLKTESATALEKPTPKFTPLPKPKQKLKPKMKETPPVVDLAGEARRYAAELRKDEVLKTAEFNERITKMRKINDETKKDILKLLNIEEDEQRISTEKFLAQREHEKQIENNEIINLLSAKTI